MPYSVLRLALNRGEASGFREHLCYRDPIPHEFHSLNKKRPGGFPLPAFQTTDRLQPLFLEYFDVLQLENIVPLRYGAQGERLNFREVLRRAFLGSFRLVVLAQLEGGHREENSLPTLAARLGRVWGRVGGACSDLCNLCAFARRAQSNA